MRTSILKVKASHVFLLLLVVVAVALYLSLRTSSDDVVLSRQQLYQDLGAIVFQQRQREARMQYLTEVLQAGARGRSDSAQYINGLLSEQQQTFAVLQALEGQRIQTIRYLEK